MEPDAVVRIDVLEEDLPALAGDVYGWCRQRLLARTVESDPHLPHQGQPRVGEQADAQPQFLRGGDEVIRRLAADGEQLVPELGQLRCYFFQLN